MAAAAALAAVTAADRGFPALFGTDHTSHCQACNAQHNYSNDHSSHNTRLLCLI